MLWPMDFFYQLTWIHLTALVTGFIALFYLSIIRRPRKVITNCYLNPFANDARRPLEPIEQIGMKKRTRRLQQTFSEDVLPSEIDAIVIGSGIGGLATAAILAKTGRKVVVLEKNAKAGGCCSSFIEHGYEWDVGLHYVGKMGPNDFERFVLDQLTEGQLDWQRLDDEANKIVFLKKDKLIVPINCDHQKRCDALTRRYPERQHDLDQFFDLIKKALRAFPYFIFLKTAPIWVVNSIVRLHLYHMTTNFFALYNKTRAKNELEHFFGDNGELKTLLGFEAAVADLEPSRCGFGLLAFMNDFLEGGAYYPIGGSSEIPNSLIPVIEKEGGRVFVNANVTEIMVTKTGEATGVRVGPVEIKAPLIISDAGISNTFHHLLPRSVAMETKIGQLLESGQIHSSESMFVTFVGLKGSQDELKLPNCLTMLVQDGGDLDRAIHAWRNLDLETAVFKAKIPFAIVSFTSAKDPTYNQRLPGRSVCTIFVASPYGWFRNWDQEPDKFRCVDYQEAKMFLANRCWRLVIDVFPQLTNCKDFIDAATPLTVGDFLNAYEGGPYGLDHDTQRFAPDVVATLRPEVPEIKGLYLTGQDVTTAGFVNCLHSALITCQTILKQVGEGDNLIGELKKLQRHVASQKQASTVIITSLRPQLANED